AAEKKDGVWVPTENPLAIAAMAELYGGEEGQSDMLRDLGLHFSVAGEGWLIGPTGGSSQNGEEWQIAAATRVRRNGGIWKVNNQELDENVLVIRLWKPHPEDKRLAEAPTRAILGTLSE